MTIEQADHVRLVRTIRDAIGGLRLTGTLADVVGFKGTDRAIIVFPDGVYAEAHRLELVKDVRRSK